LLNAVQHTLHPWLHRQGLPQEQQQVLGQKQQQVPAQQQHRRLVAVVLV
jgi:hypothetical protein